MVNAKRLTIPNVTMGFRDSNGKSASLVTDEVRNCVYSLPQKGSEVVEFHSTKLRNALLTEAHSFLDRAVYQICAAKHLVLHHKFSWAAVTMYYSSFYALCSLIRLQGKSLSWIDKRLYLVFSNNLLNDEYHIRTADSRGNHQELWSVFYAIYEGFPLNKSEFGDVCCRPVDQESELVKRNTITYRLGSGFQEFSWKADECNRQTKKLSGDVFADRHGSLKDEDLSLEIRAALRIELACEILRLIEKDSVYDSYFRDRARRRCDFVKRDLKPMRLQELLVSWTGGAP